LQESDLEVWEKAGESACGVLIVDEFTTEFEIEFIKHGDALFDFFLLDFQIFIGIKALFHVYLL
jgi:hypothetical protein